MSKANKKEARELGESCFSYPGPLGEEYFGGPLAHGPPGCSIAGRSWAFLRAKHRVRGAESGSEAAEPGAECPTPLGRPECRAPPGAEAVAFCRLPPCAHAVPRLQRHGGPLWRLKASCLPSRGLPERGRPRARSAVAWPVGKPTRWRWREGQLAAAGDARGEAWRTSKGALRSQLSGPLTGWMIKVPVTVTELPKGKTHFLPTADTLLRRFSRVRLCALCRAARQAPLCMGCSRQGCWRGPLSLLQGIFLTQSSNPGLPHCWQVHCSPSYQGS